MGILRRLPVFALLVVTDAILFIFHSRVVLTIVDIANSFASGPATGAINLLPDVLQLVMGVILLGAFAYLLGGIGEERAAARRRPPR